MKISPSFAILGLVVLAVMVAGCSSAKTYGVNIEGGGFLSSDSFNPGSITIRPGDSITWTNTDSEPHTVTSDAGTEMQSNTIASGQTYSHTFLQAGTYTYHCAIHPEMKGTVIVQ